ncbi:MAG: phosphonoacetaldehyde hydrolase [Clostridia bacterium]
MKKIEAVIFDWAGTTVDFGSFAPVGAFLETFRIKGIEPTLDEVRAPMGMLKKEHIRTMLEMERIENLYVELYGHKYTETELDEMYNFYEKALISVLNDYAEPKPFVLDTIAKLREKGIKIGSTTGYNDKMMAVIVPKAEQNGYSPDFWCSPDLVDSKSRPAPFMVFRNMEELNISSVNAVVKVGDTVSDIEEGKNAGVVAVGIIEGSSVMGITEDEWNAMSDEQKIAEKIRVSKVYKDAGADYVIDNMADLLDVIALLEK